MIVETKNFNSRWKVASELAEVTLVGRRFQMCGASNTKARLLAVESLSGGGPPPLKLSTVAQSGWS